MLDHTKPAIWQVMTVPALVPSMFAKYSSHHLLLRSWRIIIVIMIIAVFPSLVATFHVSALQKEANSHQRSEIFARFARMCSLSAILGRLKTPCGFRKLLSYGVTTDYKRIIFFSSPYTVPAPPIRILGYGPDWQELQIGLAGWLEAKGGSLR